MMRQVLPMKKDAVQRGREELGGLPRHIARVKLPSGKSLGELKGSEIAAISMLLEIPGTGHEYGKQHNCELLVSTLEAIGAEAAEGAIAAHLEAKLGSRP